MEYKAVPAFTKSIEGRAVSGIFAVHGNIDSTADISHPGSFAKTIAERASKIKFLWNHDFWGGPPVAVVKSLREVNRTELPESVLNAAPDASGGVEVVREYLDTQRGNEVLAGLKAGAITEMSYGYDAVKYDFNKVNDVEVRNLREVRLWEVSDVLWGANEATQASKSMPLRMLMKQLELYLAELKAGARHSNADVKALNDIHQAVIDLGCTTCKGVIEESNTESETGKSRAATLVVALTQLGQELELLELSLPARPN